MNDARQALRGRGDILVLIGADSPSAPMGWASLDSATHDVTGQGDCDAGAPPPGASPAQTILVVPGADALVRRLEMSARTEAQAQAAAPYLFEGSLAAGAGETHYAVGDAQDEHGRRLVAAIAATRLTEWLNACRALGATPHFVWLDCTIWPVARGEIDIVETPRRTIVAGGPLGGFGIEPALAPALFAHWRAGLSDPIAAVRLFGGDASLWRTQLGAEAHLLVSSPLDLGGEDNPLLTLARAAVEPPDYAPNLLQGTFAPQAGARSPWRIWRFAAILAVLALLLQVASMITAGWRDAREARQTLAAAERDFRAARPEVRGIVNLRAQVASLVNAIAQADHHPVLAATDPVIRALRTHPLVRLEEVRHETPGRTVHLRFSASQGPALEALTTDLRGQGLRFDVRSQSPVDGRYTVEVALESP